MLLIGIAATCLVTLQLWRITTAKDLEHFRNSVQRRHDDIDERLNVYIAMLRGVAGLLSADQQVSLEEFRVYVDRLNLPEEYPGIQGIGYTRQIRPTEHDAIAAYLHRQGLEDFHVWPDHEREEYHAIVYLEPLDQRNQAAIGYDMFTDPTRRTAMERARRQGQPAASGKVTLVQEIDNDIQAGFLIYVPVYKGGGVPETPQERRAALRGFAYSPFRAGDLFREIFGQVQTPEVRFDIYDGTEIDRKNLLYSTHETVPAEGSTDRFVTTRPLEVAGREWTVRYGTLPAFESVSSRGLVPIAAAAGVLVSLVLMSLTWRQARARRAAEQSRTAARRAARELQASEQRLQLAVDIAAMGTFDIDLRTDAVTVNEPGREIYGWAPDASLTFSQVQALFHPDDRDEVMQRVAAALDPGGPGEFELEQRIYRTDGELRWIRVRGRAFFEPDGPAHRDEQSDPPVRAVRCIGTYLDITPRKQAEEQRERILESERRAREEAERVGRMKDEFLATLSHELRTPLNAILGWATILRDGTGEGAPEDLLEGLSVIERNARAQAQLVEDLLDVSRIISGKLRLDLQPTDLSEVLEAAMASVRPAAEAKGIRLERQTDGDPGPVLADAGRLQQVLWNLLSNAVKFTPHGGRVEIRLARSDGFAEISVHDTGSGIDSQFLPHLFQRFRQADGSTTRRYGGLGLGLSIVRHLVEMHGGQVAATSAGEGQGATFTVRLPLSTGSPSTDGETSPANSSPAEGRPAAYTAVLAGLRVLVVDDEPDTRQLVQRILRSHGAVVATAADVEQALALVEQDRPDVLLSDIGMPGRDGYDLIRILRNDGLDAEALPAVAMTAFARAEDRDRTLQAGYQVHVAKPLSPGHLVDVVAALAGRREAESASGPR